MPSMMDQLQCTSLQVQNMIQSLRNAEVEDYICETKSQLPLTLIGIMVIISCTAHA